MDAEILAQWAALGVPVDEPPPAILEEALEVWDVNQAALHLFAACATQWRILTSPVGILHLGLDYGGVDVVLRRLAPDDVDPAQLFADLQAMEAAALPILNEALK